MPIYDFWERRMILMTNKEDVYRNTTLDLDKIASQARSCINEIVEASGINKGQVFVVGCSTSEICGDMIGSNSSLEVAKAVFGAIYDELNQKGIYLASQCCEHLNRAIIVEKECAVSIGMKNHIACVVPQPKAGGSFATCAYYTFKEPVALEEIQADAGIDIGGTLIGMNLKRVAVPVKLTNNKIGSANVLAARTRPKYIGGERAIYESDEDMKKRILG